MNSQILHQFEEGLQEFIRATVEQEVERRLSGTLSKAAVIPSANRGALSPTEAAVYLGVCEKTVWTLEKKKEIAKTSYGTFPLASLDAHLRKEMTK